MSKKGNLKRILLCVLLITISAFSVSSTLTRNEPNEIVACNSYATIGVNDIVDSVIEKTCPNIKDSLIKEVEQYIAKCAPKADRDLAKHIVNSGLTEDIDICFIMAQTQIETVYGTTGIGRSTNKKSLFGIYKVKYETYEEAVNAYTKLLKNKYLVKGKTEYDLMNKYVNVGGHRYAGNPKYEAELSAAYKMIKRNTKIYELQKQYI